MHKGKQVRAEAIWKAVEREPGIRAGKVARDLGVSRSVVTRTLPAMECLAEAARILAEIEDPSIENHCIVSAAS